MRWFLASIIVVHGLIHLMGPAKAFGWARLPELNLPMTRGTGVAWLLVAMLFLAAATLLALARPFPAREWWWLAALPAMVLSQSLIVKAWDDAKFGTPANVLIFVPALIAALGALPFSYRSTYQHEANAYMARTAGSAPAMTDADLAALPAPVQRYLRYVNAVDRPRVRNFRVRFTGVMRTGPTATWMPSVAEQHSSFHPDSRLFIMAARLYGVPFEALHVFTGQTATFEVKIASLVRTVDARGPEMDQSETVTMLNDMCLLAPASLVDAPITWTEVGELTARATYRHAGQTVSAILTFGDDGSLQNFESQDRYRSDGKVHERAQWSTPVERYGVVNGIKVPVVADARWKSGDVDYSYARFEITDIAYNVGAR